MPLICYCPDCAFPNQYTLEKPKFCGGCAKPITAQPIVAHKPSTKPVQRVSAPVVVESPEVEIDPSEFEIEAINAERTNKGIKFGDLAFQHKTEEIRPRLKGKKINKKKEIELLRKEASASSRIEIEDTGSE